MQVLVIVLIIAAFVLLIVPRKKAVSFSEYQMVIHTSRFSSVEFAKNEIKDLYIFKDTLPKGAVVINGSWYRGSATTKIPSGLPFLQTPEDIF